MKILKLVAFVGVIILVAYAFMSDKKVDYTVIKEMKDECNIVIKTKTDDMDTLAKNLQKEYRGKCDSIFARIGSGADEYKVKDYKGQIKIAFNNKGKIQTGLDEIGYKFEKGNVSNVKESKNDYSSKKWQDSFREISISEAESYIELTERDGNLPTDRLEEYSGVIKQQENKIIDKTVKEELNTLYNLVLNDKLIEVKQLVLELKSKYNINKEG